jgi:hypothetical protein
MAVTGGQVGHQRRQVLGQAVGVGRVVGDPHPGDAGQLRRLLRGALAGRAGDQQVDLGADLAGGGHRVQGSRLDRVVVVLGNHQDAHLR